MKPRGCVYIGKEANKVEMQELEGNRVEIYIDFKKFNEWVLGLEPKDTREMVIMDRSTLKRIKDKIRQGNKLNYEKGAVKVLLDCFNFVFNEEKGGDMEKRLLILKIDCGKA